MTSGPFICEACDGTAKGCEQCDERGYVWGEDTDPELIRAVETLRAEVRAHNPRGKQVFRRKREGAPLTVREVEVVLGVADGLTNRVLAARLFISESTVHNHLASISDKLGIRGRAGLIAFAFRSGLKT